MRFWAEARYMYLLGVVRHQLPVSEMHVTYGYFSTKMATGKVKLH